jgi:CsoR family transcriptional regulator, copper-sensing transcriptional repressor
VKPTHGNAVLNRLKAARGHLDAVIRMVEDDALLPRHHQATFRGAGFGRASQPAGPANKSGDCVVAAMRSGREAEILDELMEAPLRRISIGPGEELSLATSSA